MERRWFGAGQGRRGLERRWDCRRLRSPRGRCNGASDTGLSSSGMNEQQLSRSSAVMIVAAAASSTVVAEVQVLLRQLWGVLCC